MGYDLTANNKKLDSFHMGAFSFPLILEITSYLYPHIHQNGQYYSVYGEDIPDHGNGGSTGRFTSAYPLAVSNDGWFVTADESKIMTRFVRNFVLIQRALPEEKRPDIHGPKSSRPFPMKIRNDFVDKFEEFADWAEQSDGFYIN